MWCSRSSLLPAQVPKTPRLWLAKSPNAPSPSLLHWQHVCAQSSMRFFQKQSLHVSLAAPPSPGVVGMMESCSPFFMDLTPDIEIRTPWGGPGHLWEPQVTLMYCQGWALLLYKTQGGSWPRLCWAEIPLAVDASSSPLSQLHILLPSGTTDDSTVWLEDRPWTPLHF
jgi:hypothetical protein